MMSLVSSAPASSKISTFTDPDAYAQAVRALQAEVVIAGRGNFRGELIKVDFRRLWMQRGHETVPRVAWIKTTSSRAPIFFLTTMNQASMIDSGMEVSPGDIVSLSLGATFHRRTSGTLYWGAMSLTPEDLAAIGRGLLGRDLTAPSITFRMRPTSALMSRLVHLHASAGRLAKAAPETFAQPEVARALEQNLLHAMVRCLADGTPIESSKYHRQHAAALGRLEELLVTNYDRPLYLAEICPAIGVSERTLRLCSEEHLGMGPIRYLWLRRMHLARRALTRADSATMTVTKIATGHGFWELGRFAVAYRTLFGESPSATLTRPPVDRPIPQHHPFTFATGRIA
jgi:AraC-like DNA-binding protein